VAAGRAFVEADPGTSVESTRRPRCSAAWGAWVGSLPPAGGLKGNGPLLGGRAPMGWAPQLELAQAHGRH